MEEFAWKDKTILIAEDDFINRMLLNEILKPTGARISTVKNGLEALELCKCDENIDLVLMDLEMPLMNGFEAFAEIKKFRSNMPIIAQTAYAFHEEKLVAYQTGFTDYIVKPFKRNIVLEVINKYFK